MSSSEALWITEQEVVANLDVAGAIDTLVEAHRLYARGAAANMVKTHVSSGQSNLHAIGGIIDGLEVAGTKTWLHSKGGAQPLLILFSPTTGSVMAIIEAFAMGQRRTAATSGVATKFMSRPDSATMTLVGTGKQSIAQAEAVAAVRPIATITVWGRNDERRAAAVETLQSRVETYVREEPDLTAALAHADIATVITRADEPFLSGEQLPDGIHVNGVGAILPHRRELDVSAVARAARIAVDSLPQAQAESGELRSAVQEGAITWEDVVELGAVVDGTAEGRTDDSQVTFFKALGVGIADIAIGAELLNRARAEGWGRPFDVGIGSKVAKLVSSNDNGGNAR